MERRDFLSGGIGAAGALAGLASVTAAAQNLPAVNWRLASSFPKSLDTIYGGAEQFARIVDAVTGGKFKVSIVDNASIAPAKTVFEAVQNANVECAHTAGYYFLSVNKALAFDTTLPFGLNQRQHNAWVYQGGGAGAAARTLRPVQHGQLPDGQHRRPDGWLVQQGNPHA